MCQHAFTDAAGVATQPETVGEQRTIGRGDESQRNRRPFTRRVACLERSGGPTGELNTPRGEGPRKQKTMDTNLDIPTRLEKVATLEGATVLLKPVSPDDTERVYDACQDAQFAKWLPFASEGYTWEQAEQFTKQLVPQSWAAGNPLWGIYALDKNGRPGALAGTIDIRDQGEGVWEIGFWMHRDSQGKGLTTAANRLAVDAAFKELGAKRILHHAKVGNHASRRIARNLGFRPEGVRRIELPNGTIENQWQSALLHFDWQESDALAPNFPPVPPAHVLPGDRPADLVAEFHHVYGMPNRVDEGARADLDFERLNMRMSLIKEEVTELVDAVYGGAASQELSKTLATLSDELNRDVVETADALADLIYVIYGMAFEVGIDLDEVLAEVHSSNLSKLMPDGSVKRREDGKILKGPNFREPRIAKVLESGIEPTSRAETASK